MKKTLIILLASALATALGAQDSLETTKASIESVIKSEGKDSRMKIAQQLRVLSKHEHFAEPDGIGNRLDLCWKATRKLMMESTGEETDIALAAIESMLDEIDKKIDKDWSFIPVSLNIDPPKGVRLAFSGMNPDAIKDTELKRQYLATIEENEKNNQKNQQQTALRSSKEKILRTAAAVASMKNRDFTKEKIVNSLGKRKENRDTIESYISE